MTIRELLRKIKAVRPARDELGWGTNTNVNDLRAIEGLGVRGSEWTADQEKRGVDGR